MDQSKVWDYFQNHEEGNVAFSNAGPRYEYLARQTSKGMSVLNIGVGRGALEVALVARGVIVSCLDPSAETIERMRIENGFGERAQVGHSQAMPFADRQFDVVIMTEVLEHLGDEELRMTLKEVRRVLKPAGRFIGTVPANEVLLNNRVMCPHCGETFHRWGHAQSFSPRRLREMLTGASFKVRRSETRAFPNWRRPGLANLIKSAVRYVLSRAGAPITSPKIYFDAAA